MGRHVDRLAERRRADHVRPPHRVVQRLHARAVERALFHRRHDRRFDVRPARRRLVHDRDERLRFLRGLRNVRERTPRRRTSRRCATSSRTLHAPYQLPAGPDTIDVEVSTDLVVPGDTVAVTAHIDSSRFNQSNGSQTVNNIANARPLRRRAAVGHRRRPADGCRRRCVRFAGRNGHRECRRGRRRTPLRLRAGRRHRGQLGHAECGVLRCRRREPDRHDQRHRHRPCDERSAERHHRVAQSRQRRDAQGDQRSRDRRLRGARVPRHVRCHGHGAAPHRADAERPRARGRLDRSRENFSMLADCVFFDDDVENGSALWTAQTPWVVSTNVPGNTTHVWNTPNYGDDIDRSLTTAASYDLTGYSGATLDFDDRCDTESGFDFGYVEFSTNGGSTWTTLYSCSGQSSWQSHHLELPAAADGATRAQGALPPAERRFPERARLGRRQYPLRGRRRRVHRTADRRRDLRGRVRALRSSSRLRAHQASPVRAECARVAGAIAVSTRFTLAAEASLQQDVRKSRFVAQRGAGRNRRRGASRSSRASTQRDATHNCWAYRIGAQLSLQRRRRARRHRRQADPAGHRRTGARSRRRRRHALVRRHQARRRRARARLRRHAPPNACGSHRNRRSSNAHRSSRALRLRRRRRVARAAGRLRRDRNATSTPTPTASSS